MAQKLTLGFSPCPNDTFMFDALVNGRIDTGELEFEVVMADVEALNQMAFEGKLDITKLSYHALAHATESYGLLYSGSALGHNCGPLLIAQAPASLDAYGSADKKIAIPGRFTTANFLLGLALPQASNKIEMLFSEVESAVLSGECDAGLIIHENRFTYAEKGLHKIIDLGEYWENTHQLPIPLGGIAAHRRLDSKLARQVDALIGQSVNFAFDNPKASSNYVKAHAQEMDEAVMRSHIELYVNEYSVALGQTGEAAVNRLFDTARSLELVPNSSNPIFSYSLS